MFFFPLGTNIAYHRRPYVCYAILGLNTLIFLATLLKPYQEFHHFIFRPFNDELYTTVTSAFHHAGFMHFILNMLIFYIVGFNVESKMGHVKFAVFYIMAACVAALTHGIQSQMHGYLGASGAIFALIGAYIVLYAHAKINILFFPIHFAMMMYFFIEPPIYGLHPLVALVMLAGYALFWKQTFPAWQIFLVYMLFQLRMGLAYQATGMSQVSFWGHIGGFGFGVFFAWLFYGISGFFRNADGSLKPFAPDFLRRREAELVTSSGILGPEGGIAYLEDMQPERMDAIARLQELVYLGSSSKMVDEYEMIYHEYPHIVLAPKPHYSMITMLEDAGRHDLMTQAAEKLIEKHSDSKEARLARYKLAHFYSTLPAQYLRAMDLIAELRENVSYMQEEQELDHLEASLAEKMKLREEFSGELVNRDAPQGETFELGFVPEEVEQPPDEALAAEFQLFDSSIVSELQTAKGGDEEQSEQRMEPPSVLPSAESDMIPEILHIDDAPSAKDATADSDSDVAAAVNEIIQLASRDEEDRTDAPPPIPTDYRDEEPKPVAAAPEPQTYSGESAQHPGRKIAVPWGLMDGLQMVLLHPEKPVDFKQLVDAIEEYFEVDSKEAERRFRTGKGVLMKETAVGQCSPFTEFLKSKNCEPLVLPAMRDLQYPESQDITSFDLTPKRMLCRSYAGEFFFGWDDILLLSAGKLSSPGIGDTSKKKVIDIYLRRPQAHIRIWESLFNFKRSTYDGEPLRNALLKPLFTNLKEYTPHIFQSKSFENAIESNEREPHEFESEEEFENYNLWSLYTLCADWKRR